MASPIITSTQEPLKRKSYSNWSEMSTVTKHPNCQTEKDIQSNTGSTLTYDSVSNSYGTITSASEDENQAIEKIENMEEKSSITQEEMKQSEIQKDKNQALRCVFLKVSKNLRDRRLRELELKHQQCDKEQGGGHGDRVVSGESARKNVNAALDTTSETHTSSTGSTCKNFLSHNLAQDNLSFGKESQFVKVDKRGQTGTKNISAVLQQKLSSEAETRKELHAKLSGFIFKPRKMRSSVHNHDLNVNAQFQTECYSGIHTDMESRISRKKPVSQDDSASPQTDTEKKNEIQNHYQSVSGGGSKRKQASCVSEVGDSMSEVNTCFTSKELQNDVFSFGKNKLAEGKTEGRIKRRDDTENLSQQQKIRVNTGDETKVNGFTCIPPLNPSTYISNPGPSKTGHTKSTVASSTLSKLTRFSFTCTNEPITTAQSKVENNLPAGVEKSKLKRDNAECLRGNSKDKETKNCLEQGTESPTKKMSKYKEKQVKPTHSANHSKSVKTVNDDPVDFQNTVNMNKRKCFELCPPPSSVVGSRGPFSGLSMFGSVELDNDVLHTDWDQEVSKKVKI